MRVCVIGTGYVGLVTGVCYLKLAIRSFVLIIMKKKLS